MQNYRTDWRPDEIHALADKMSGCVHGFHLSKRSAALVVRALRFYAGALIGVEGGYRIDQWDSPQALKIVDKLAETVNYHMAKAAYDAALAARPGAAITLRQGARVLESTLDEQI
jgi:hypothetical protein